MFPGIKSAGFFYVVLLMQDPRKNMKESLRQMEQAAKGLNEAITNAEKLTASLPAEHKAAINVQISAMKKAAANQDLSALNKVISDLGKFA